METCQRYSGTMAQRHPFSTPTATGGDGTGMMTKQMRLAPVGFLAAALTLAGCASRASRVEGALVKAGLSERMAACLAPRLADRLSNDQLRTLAAAAKRPAGDSGRTNAREVVARVAATGDPEIIDAVSKAGLHCVLKG